MRDDLFTTRRAGSDPCAWLPDPGRLSLPEKTVQVWVLDDSFIEAACTLLGGTLSPDERQRAGAYRQDKHRNQFVARRSVLRWLIGGYLAREPESLRFGVTRFGKPALKGRDAARLAFSVSRTDGLAAFAFAWDCRVGVDVERRIDGLDIAGIGRGIFSRLEERTLGAARDDPSARVLRVWTRKEALLKALGTGLAGKPDTYTTENDSRHGEDRWRASHHGVPLSGWTCVDLVAGPQILGALAVSLDDACVTLQLCHVSKGANLDATAIQH